MVNDKPYSERLVCSKKVKWYINNPVKEKFIKEYPENEGHEPTENQILTYLIKKDLGIFYLKKDG